MPAQDSCLTLNRHKLLAEVNRRHLKRESLAEDIGVTPRTLRRWLHGQTTQVQMIHLDQLAQKLGCAVRDLILDSAGTVDIPDAPAVHPILRQLRHYVLKGTTAHDFACATQLVQGCGRELSLDIQAAALHEYARFAFSQGQTSIARQSFERAVMKADAAGLDPLRFQSFLGLAQLSSMDPDGGAREMLFLEQADHVLIRMQALHFRPYLWLMEARLAVTQGDLEKGFHLAQNAAAQLNFDPSEATLDTIEAMDILASVWQAVGIRRKAHDLLSTASTMAQNILATDHPMRGRILSRQSSINGFLGARELSEQQSKEAVRILDAVLPMESFDRTSAWIQYGAALSDQGKFEQGLVAMRQGIGGHPEQEPRLRTNLGLLLHRMGRYEESAAQGKRAVELYTSKFGPNHPETAGALGRYANPIESLGQVETAEQMFRDAARLLHASDPFHVRILDQVRNQASCLMTMNRHDEAAKILEEHRKIYTQRDESPFYQGRYSFLQAKASARLPQKQDAALQLAMDAKKRFTVPGLDPSLRHEAEVLISTIRRAP